MDARRGWRSDETHRRRLGRSIAGVVSRRHAPRVPLGPPPARASSPLHDGRRWRAGAGGDLPGLGRAAPLVERRLPAPRPRRRPVVLRARLVRGGRHRVRAGSRSDRPAPRRRVAPPLPRRPRLRRGRRGRPAGTKRVGGRLGRRRDRGWAGVGGVGRIGLVPLHGRSSGPRGSERHNAVRADLAARGARPRTGRRSCRDRRGLLERSRHAERQRQDRRRRRRGRRGSVGGARDRRPRGVVRRGDPLVRAVRRNRYRMRPHRARWVTGGGVGGRSVHRRRYHEAGVRSRRRRRRRLHDASSARHRAGACPFRSRDARVGKAHLVQRSGRRRHRLPRHPITELDGG